MAGVYVHIPFCRQRCSYCDFYFVTGSRDHDRFVQTVVDEIGSVPDRYRVEKIETIYFGGGTPSRLSVKQLERICTVLDDVFVIDPAAERTIEINPEDSSPDYVAGLASLGFNRLSVGIQSFDDDSLRFMLRSHTAAQARAVIDTARQAGFSQISIDLIFGLPGQEIADWMTGVAFAVDREIPHVSTYGLTVEPRTLLNKWIRDGAQQQPDENLMADMYLATIDRLASAGFHHYEISSFAQAGSESRHNGAYWRHANYLGFGPSAHSFWWDTVAARWSNVRNLRKYLESVAIGETSVDNREILTSDQLISERVMLGLRTASGVSRSELRSRYGCEFSEWGEKRITDLKTSGKLTDSASGISLTQAGRLVSNAVTRYVCDDLAFRHVLDRRN
ncbi:radical SAM family heme chaperone HemW [Bacteroidota bacterium]